MKITDKVKKVKIMEQSNDRKYWMNRTCQERIDALEKIREEYNNWRYNAEQGFQRVYRVTEL